MKHLILLLTSMFSLSLANAQTLDALTFNIRYDNTRDAENQWDNRKDKVVQLIDFYHPDVFGIQEGLYHQVEYIDESLDDYKYIGVGRDDGLTKGEFSALFYNEESLQVLKQSTFWLSESPDEISVGWDASMERICTYGRFKDKKSGVEFWVFNTHFDHIGPFARENSAKLILQKIEELNPDRIPIIVMGDLNSEPASKPIQIFNKSLRDALTISLKPLYGPPGTFNGFNPDAVMDRRIDYIFTSGFKVLSHTHIDNRRDNNLHVSDHLAVLVKLIIDH